MRHVAAASLTYQNNQSLKEVVLSLFATTVVKLSLLAITVVMLSLRIVLVGEAINISHSTLCREISALKEETIVDISMGETHAICCNAHGEVFIWVRDFTFSFSSPLHLLFSPLLSSSSSSLFLLFLSVSFLLFLFFVFLARSCLSSFCSLQNPSPLPPERAATCTRLCPEPQRVSLAFQVMMRNHNVTGKKMFLICCGNISFHASLFKSIS